MILKYESASLAVLIEFSGFFNSLEIALGGTSQDTIEKVSKNRPIMICINKIVRDKI